MSYKGYRDTVEYTGDDRIPVGRIIGINDVIGFHADNVDDLISAFQEAVDDCIRLAGVKRPAVSSRCRPQRPGRVVIGRRLPRR
jgi:predicted HicB family RNase H-like nuclease